MKNKTSKLVRWITALAFLGVLLSFYSLMHKQGFTEGAFCNLNDTFSCDIVNQGPYSDIAGIPIALIGVIGYLFMAVAAFMKQKNPEDKKLSQFLVASSVGGFLFALYLSGLEAFVLHAWCMLCLTSQGLITAIMTLSILDYRKTR
jgi:uncharacterized membrane protein